MSEQLVFRKSLPIGLAALAHWLVTPITAIACLWALAEISDVVFDQNYVVLSLLAGVICLVLFDVRTAGVGQLLPRKASLSGGVFMRWVALVVILLVIGFATKMSSEYSRRVMLIWFVVTPFFLIVANLAVLEVRRRLVLDPSNKRRVVFAGFNDVSQRLAQRLKSNSDLCMGVDGYFDDRSVERLTAAPGAERILGRLPDLADYVKIHGIDVIFVSLPIRHVARVMQLLDDLRDTTASIYYVPDIFVFDLIQARAGDIQGMPVVALCETPFAGYRGVLKRAMDILIASTALVVMSPLILLIALMVRQSSPGPIIFRQRRYGLDGKEITVYKFRTMNVMENSDRVVQASRGDARVTRVGRFLRRYSLDELPQLLNVVQGRMSLVGPRPHAVAHNEEYRKLIKGYMVRHKVLPGITGLAQVSGCRGETTTLDAMQARIEYDLEYLRSWSIKLDLVILFRTAVQLFRDDKAY
jgi:putative colanic acid biosynthesis UDP-glucose lipid carrier transferase